MRGGGGLEGVAGWWRRQWGFQLADPPKYEFHKLGVFIGIYFLTQAEESPPYSFGIMGKMGDKCLGGGWGPPLWKPCGRLGETENKLLEHSKLTTKMKIYYKNEWMHSSQAGPLPHCTGLISPEYFLGVFPSKSQPKSAENPQNFVNFWI